MESSNIAFAAAACMLIIFCAFDIATLAKRMVALNCSCCIELILSPLIAMVTPSLDGGKRAEAGMREDSPAARPAAHAPHMTNKHLASVICSDPGQTEVP